MLEFRVRARIRVKVRARVRRNVYTKCLYEKVRVLNIWKPINA